MKAFFTRSLTVIIFTLLTAAWAHANPTCVPTPVPTAFPTDKWSVSVYSDIAFTNYVGYYNQNNTGTSGLGLYFASSDAWSSTANPTATVASSGTNSGTPPGTGTYSVEAFNGCSFAGSTNFSFIYRRTSTLPAGIYTLDFRQTVAKGNSFSFKVNGVTYISNAEGIPTIITLYLPVNAQLEVAATHGNTVGSTLKLRTVAATTPSAMSPGTLVADKSTCYNTDPGTNFSATVANSGDCSGLLYQWQSASSASGPWTDISGATAANYDIGKLKATTYYKRIASDYCARSVETSVLTISVGATPVAVTPGTIGTDATVCTGSSVLLTNVVSGANGYTDSTISYQWYTNADVLISGATNSTYTTPVLSATTGYKRKAISTSACGTVTSTGFSNTVTITVVNTPVVPSSITGTTAQCVGNTGVVYSAAAVSTATSYAWTLPVGVTAVSGATTRNITVDFVDGYTGGTISCNAVNACGAGLAASLVLTVDNCINTWTGATNTTWATATNWSTGTVPGAGTNVVIPDVANKPAITTGNAYANNITIDLNSSLTISGTAILRVSGNITNNGSLVTASVSRIQAVKSSGIQTFAGNLSGIKYLLKAGNGTLQLANDWVITGRVDLRAGTINVNGNAVTFDVINGGYIGYTSGDAGTITGNITVTKPLGQYTHNIASPLDGITATQINDDFPVINTSNGNKSRLFSWDISTQKWGTTGLPLSTSLNRGAGYNFYCLSSGILDFTGTYTQTATPYVLSGTAVAAGNFILFGNPYLADLNWETIGKTNVNATVYYWNQSAKAYATYTTGGSATNGGTINVPVMQGFFVTSTAAGSASISISPSAIITSSPLPVFYRLGATSDKFNLIVKDSSGKSDEVSIVLNDDATLGFDGEMDVYKLQNPGTSLNFYTTAGTTDYTVNAIPTTATDQPLALSFVAPERGVYTIESANVNVTTTEVYLKDKVTGTITPIKSLPYTFTADNSDNADRFDILFRTAATTSTQNAAIAAGIKFASFQKDLVILNQSLQISNGTIVITDLSGNAVKTISGATISDHATFNLSDLTAGMYMIKLIDQANGNSYSGKVSIQ